jgi:hypothetical protein
MALFCDVLDTLARVEVSRHRILTATPKKSFEIILTGVKQRISIKVTKKGVAHEKNVYHFTIVYYLNRIHDSC